jgi:class 3 adenylate cyclase
MAEVGKHLTRDAPIPEARLVSAEIRYAKSDDVFIAYQALGESGRDLLVVMDGFIPIDTMEDEPRLARSMRRLASFSRVIRFDRRGIGLSDPVAAHAPPTLEQWAADGMAVLDAVGARDAVLLASAEASPVALLMAAAYTDRVQALVIVNGFARILVDDDYPIGLTRDEIDDILRTTDPIDDTSIEGVARFAPSAAVDEHFREWWRATGRRGASPATARALMRVAFECDVRAVLPAVRLPVLVVYLRDGPAVAGARYLAASLPNAKLVEVPGADDYWWASDAARDVLDEIEEFLTGARMGANPDRRLVTLLFTDIVGSTEQTSRIGDARWRDVLDRHDTVVRRQFARFHGREIKTLGDGFLATFDGPASAVECACAIRQAAGQLGLDVRIGVHTGEVEVRGDDIAGIAVDIAARIAALAPPRTVLASRTVADLVTGSGLRFAEHGAHALKGVPGTWTLCVVES